MNEIQVNKSHYAFSSYSHLGRWASYFFQLSETFNYDPQNVLEVGVGDKVFGSFIKNNTSTKYTSVDIAADLHPDIIGDVLHLPFQNKSFDVVCAFEVLEHLPFEHFEKAVSELARVSKKAVLISLPHFGPPIKFLIKIPFLPEMKFSFKISLFKKHIFNGQHYFEIGKKGFSVKKIIRVLEKYGVLKKHFVPFENQYHHFFTIESNES